MAKSLDELLAVQTPAPVEAPLVETMVEPTIVDDDTIKIADLPAHTLGVVMSDAILDDAQLEALLGTNGDGPAAGAEPAAEPEVPPEVTDARADARLQAEQAAGRAALDRRR